MLIYVCCPPREATGGIELIHQLVYELNRQCPGIAQILYIDNTPEVGGQVPLQYIKEYNNPYTVNDYEERGAVIILPEIWAAMAETCFKGHPTVIWWESVDNYFAATPREAWYSFVRDKSMLHMTQSMYAKDFLIRKAGVPEDRIIEVSDYLSENFMREKVKLDASGRKPKILYNPRKGMDFTNKLIEALPKLDWTPIQGMSSEDVTALMSESRLYIDFGNHPGKDRMPREAAISGCCIVTGRNGSASYYEDVPIGGDYKFERKESNIPAICSRIEQLVNEYDRYIGDFKYYRSVIRGEKEKFEEAVGRLITVLREHYSLGEAEDKVIAFCSYLKIKEEEKALELLSHISLEEVKNRRIAVLSAGLMAGDAVYEALCSKLTAMQWEEWSGEILEAFAVSLTEDEVYEQQLKRLSGILMRISVSSVLSWLEQSDIAKRESVREKLLAYALACVEEGKIFTEESLVQELALCAQVLKAEYAKRRESEEGKRLLRGYVMATGAFAERHYNPEHLIDPSSHVVPPETCAAYRMAMALADGTPSSENVALLKQALEIFPPFHQEIRGILTELAGAGK